MQRRISALVLAVAGVCVAGHSAKADLVTGFEPPAYLPGSIIGQQGWTANPSGTFYNNFAVSTSNPKTGLQALLISDVTPVQGQNFGPQLISPATATGSSSTLTSFNFDITGVTPGTGNARHDLYVVSNAAADVDPKYGFNDYVGGVSFQSNGHILVEEYSPDFGGFMSLTDTGVLWTPNVYHSFGIKVDATSTDMQYTYDGTLLADTTAFYETSVGNAVFRQDLSNVAGEGFSVDNFSVTAIPEPATAGILGMMGLAVAGRRPRARR